MNKATISDIVKTLMFKKNIKTTQLARELNLPQQTLQRIVSGITPKPHITSLKPIAEYFDISVAQLKGEQPLPESLVITDLSVQKNKIKKIPLFDWDSIKKDFDTKKLEKIDEIFANDYLNEQSFSLIMNDTSMEPYFPREAILIFDPEKNVKDRCFVLCFIKEIESAIFRQLLIDGDHKYLKPLNPDLSTFNMRLLTKDDQIIAPLAEFRHIYKDF